MPRRKKLLGKTKEYFEKADKGRKKPWQPRGEPIPPGVTHSPKKRYRRDRFSWRDVSQEDNDELREE